MRFPIAARIFAGLALATLSAAPSPAQLARGAEVRREGLNLNAFVQQGPVAAHVVLRSGTDPRLIVAFPAGNSGVGLWFAPLRAAAEWTMTAEPAPVTDKDARGRALHGVAFTIRIRTPQLAIRKAVLSSVRVLRDYQGLGTTPAEVAAEPRVRDRSVIWARDRLDGAPGYRLALRIVRGTLNGETIGAAPDGQIELAVTALTGETPLTPFPPGTLLTDRAAADPATRTALQFLSYHEKFMAGSWRFNTYFGRDTLMSVRLLMPALSPAAVETGLRSVLARLSPAGDVAHEEDIGEFAILDHRRAGEGTSDAPTYNYSMIDSVFLLAPVAQAWLLDDPRGRARAAAFLAERQSGQAVGDALMRNLRFVAAQAAAFSAKPEWRNLIALKPGMEVGEWRDSNDGLGGGRYPYDVNAVLVPAALEAADALARAGLLQPYMAAGDRRIVADLASAARVWRERAPPMFLQSVAPTMARAAIERYASTQSIPAAPALNAIGKAPLRYHAIALDTQGQAVPILNSDEGFALLFGHPSPDALEIATETMVRPFPAGLMTDAGMLVANPVLAPPPVQARFGPGAYHGTVIWSWQQAMAAAGLARQLARADLPPALCRRLGTAQDMLWNAIDATRAVRSSELWSWRYADGRYQVVPFGASGGDVDESNAAQLWSTVYLAVQRPTPGTARCLPR
jgi:hypothetical protein